MSADNKNGLLESCVHTLQLVYCYSLKSPTGLKTTIVFKLANVNRFGKGVIKIGIIVFRTFKNKMNSCCDYPFIICPSLGCTVKLL